MCIVPCVVAMTILGWLMLSPLDIVADAKLRGLLRMQSEHRGWICSVLVHSECQYTVHFSSTCRFTLPFLCNVHVYRSVLSMLNVFLFSLSESPCTYVTVLRIRPCYVCSTTLKSNVRTNECLVNTVTCG